jgi:hypothetical protein
MNRRTGRNGCRGPRRSPSRPAELKRHDLAHHVAVRVVPEIGEDPDQRHLQLVQHLATNLGLDVFHPGLVGDHPVRQLGQVPTLGGEHGQPRRRGRREPLDRPREVVDGSVRGVQLGLQGLLQPFCNDCGTTEDLPADPRWPRQAEGLPI